MTNEMCQCHCLSEGKALAGTQNFHICYCGDVVPPEQKPEAECDMPCKGNSSQICGGYFRNSVYGTGLDLA